MRNRLRKLIESIVYAGLKPDRGAQAQEPAKGTQWLRRILDRIASGGAAPSDPLYLSNRTLGQKLRLPLLIGIPSILIAGFIFLAMSSEYFQPKDAAPVQLSPAEVASRMLPDLRGVKIDVNRDVEIVDVHVDQGAGRLAGTVRNNTGRTIGTVDALFDLADLGGSRLGTVKTQFKNLAPRSASNFTIPIEQRNAVFVIVREVRAR